MIEILDRMGNSELGLALSEHSTSHFTKRLAYLDSDGHPPRNLLEDPRHVFVLEAKNRFGRIETALRQSIGLILQIQWPPPTEWLKKVALTREAFAQQTLDHFTLVLYSTLDRCLLLANLLMSLGVHDRLATYRTIHKEMKAKDQSIAQAFADLYEATSPLSDPRHFFAHRGEPRKVGLFSTLTRMKQIVGAWGASTEGVTFPEEESWSELRAQMTTDVTGVAMRALTSCDALTDHYEAKIESLGGIDLPTDAERARALEAARYFEGGEKPSFMNVGS